MVVVSLQHAKAKVPADGRAVRAGTDSSATTAGCLIGGCLEVLTGVVTALLGSLTSRMVSVFCLSA